MEQPGHVMIRGDEQARRVLERLVEGEPARIDVPVRADQRQLLDRVVELAGDRTNGRVDGKQPVRMQLQQGCVVGGGHVPIIRDAAGGGNSPRREACKDEGE